MMKPADFDLVKNTVTRVIDSRRLARAHEALRDQYGLNEPFVVGESPAMRELFAGAKRAAHGDQPDDAISTASSSWDRAGRALRAA